MHTALYNTGEYACAYRDTQIYHQAHMVTCAYTHTHTHTHTYTHIHTLKYTHRETQTHTHTYAHTLKHAYSELTLFLLISKGLQQNGNNIKPENFTLC